MALPDKKFKSLQFKISYTYEVKEIASKDLGTKGILTFPMRAFTPQVPVLLPCLLNEVYITLQAYYLTFQISPVIKLSQKVVKFLTGVCVSYMVQADNFYPLQFSLILMSNQCYTSVVPRISMEME